MYRNRTEKFGTTLEENLFPTEEEENGNELAEYADSDFPALINRRAAEGGELVTYTHVAGKYNVIGHYLLTFRKKLPEAAEK